MDFKKIVQQNTILVVKTGSHLYGTNGPESDEDFVGIYFPPEESVFGFLKADEIDMSIHSKDERGKNTKDAIDIKYYDFRKFVKLALENNPNILEILFANDKNIVFINDFGKELLDMKSRFPWVGLKNKFLGYAFSQKHKMIIKRNNYFDLVKALDFLNFAGAEFSLWEIQGAMDKSIFQVKKNSVNNSVDFYQVGDINFMPSISVKRARKMIQERLDKVGNREELYLKHAYDTKFAMHLVRLMYEGLELLKTGKLEFPLAKEELDVLRKIRNGEFPVEYIFEISSELEKLLEAMSKDHLFLPSKPRFDEIQSYTISAMKKWYKEQI